MLARRGPVVLLAACLAVLVGVVGTLVLRDRNAEGVGSLPPGVVVATATSPTTANPITSVLTSGIPKPTPVQPRPIELIVASVGIEAPVDPVGVTADNVVAIPPDAHRVGWYRFGPAPGDSQGSAVIVGHVDSRTQGIGALFPLSSVQPGDVIQVRRADHSTLSYRVVERRLYLKQGLKWDLFFTSDGPARLTVITCGGPYLRPVGGYQDNLIVTAVPIATR